MRTILVTGAAGFIGSNFVRMLMKRGEDVKLVAFDKLTYAGNLANLQDLLSDKRLVFVKGDICDEDQPLVGQQVLQVREVAGVGQLVEGDELHVLAALHEHADEV